MNTGDAQHPPVSGHVIASGRRSCSTKQVISVGHAMLLTSPRGLNLLAMPTPQDGVIHCASPMDSERTTTSEREQTDESLRAERDKADHALEVELAAIDETADAVISRARGRADAVLAAARAKTDRQLKKAPGTPP